MFGYVTKLLIPITSVAKISKEKTVKIIPNAIAVATIDERHVFSSFLSREAAYQLMISVWREALPTSDINLTSASAQLRIGPEKNSTNSSNSISGSKLSDDFPVFEKMASSTLQVMNQHRTSSHSGVSELDDESSSAISGSEGLVHLIQSQKPILAGEQHLITNSHNSISSSNSNFNNISKSNCDFLASRESAFGIEVTKCLMDTNSLTSTPKLARPLSKPNSTTTDQSSLINIFKLQIPRTVHIAYFGLSLVIILALLAGFLFYRISEMKNARLGTSFSIDDLNAVSK